MENLDPNFMRLVPIMTVKSSAVLAPKRKHSESLYKRASSDFKKILLWHLSIICEQSERISPMEIVKFSKGGLNHDLQLCCAALRAANSKWERSRVEFISRSGSWSLPCWIHEWRPWSSSTRGRSSPHKCASFGWCPHRIWSWCLIFKSGCHFRLKFMCYSCGKSFDKEQTMQNNSTFSESKYSLPMVFMERGWWNGYRFKPSLEKDVPLEGKTKKPGPRLRGPKSSSVRMRTYARFCESPLLYGHRRYYRFLRQKEIRLRKLSGWDFQKVTMRAYVLLLATALWCRHPRP